MCIRDSGNTEEGKEVIAIYSHNGYQWAKSEDYDSERAAQEMCIRDRTKALSRIPI